MALHTIRKAAVVTTVAGLGALLVGCGSQDTAFARTEAANAAIAQTQPVAVSCEPMQRAVVRQVAVNGVLQAQVQCETVAIAASAGAPAAAAAYQPGFQTVAYVPSAPLDNTRMVQASYPALRPAVVTRQVAARPVAYQRAPERIVRPKRSVKKSAIIIGSSAGVAAGLGAVIGGKKGAGIGALVGGGGAALWDQITRRQQ